MRGGEHRLAVGSAGSTTLVLQTVLPALVVAGSRRALTLEGGTHNPSAPPFDFLARTFVPVLRRMGAGIEPVLECARLPSGGGGRFTVDIVPVSALRPVSLIERGPTTIVARALVAGLPEHIGRRELEIVRERLQLDRAQCRVERLPDAVVRATCVLIEITSPEGTEIVCGFGRKSVPAEEVAAEAAADAEAFLAADVPVGAHLADQLLVPMARRRRRHVPHRGADGTHAHQRRRDSAFPGHVDSDPRRWRQRTPGHGGRRRGWTVMKSRERKALLEANGPFVARAADAPYQVWGADQTRRRSSR